jgi:hypothetical protein
VPPKLKIDRAKLRCAVRKLDNKYVYFLLDEALELLPDAKLVRLVRQYIDIKALRPDGAKKGDVFAEVVGFEKASRGGKYFESFNVNSKNYREVSNGTRAWIAECRRLLERLVAGAPKGNPSKVVGGFETMFGLLRELDRGTEMIFVADEGGSWLVGANWREVFPAYFSCLAKTTEAEEYARRVIAVVDEFAEYDRKKHLAVAGRAANSAQRKALRGSARKAP